VVLETLSENLCAPLTELLPDAPRAQGVRCVQTASRPASAGVSSRHLGRCRVGISVGVVPLVEELE